MIATLKSNHRATIVALATPLGESAIGMLRLSGNDAREIVGKLYRGRKLWKDVRPREAVRGAFVYPHGEVLDEGVFLWYAGPHSYTGEDVVEIMLHGNPWILLEAQRLCVEGGATLARPGEFTERAYLNGKMDLNQAEAVNDLIRAHTRLAKSAALSQLQGKLSHLIGEVHTELLDMLAKLEAAIDHSDLEETFFGVDEAKKNLCVMMKKLQSLLDSSRAGQMLRLGIKVVIIGSPNVGKSSLFNLLVDEDRAIVTDIPGTTRDTLEVEIQIEGIPFRLIDTAGIRDTVDVIEQEGIRRTQRAVEMADVCLAVFDAQRLPSDEDRELLKRVKEKKLIPVVNKVETPHYASKYDFLVDPVLISVRERKNIEKLHKRLASMYFSLGYDPQVDVLLTNERQKMLIKDAIDFLNRAYVEMEKGISEEYIAHYLHRARMFLEEMVGKTTHEDILERIFSQFCIGK